MKRIIIFAFLMMGMAFFARAYDFSAVAPSGQTLYFDINAGHAEVVNKGSQNHIYGGYFGGNWISGDLIIPDTVYYNNFPLAVKVIQSAAFRNQSALHSVVIPNTVTSIGIDAFHNCSGLSSLTIPLSVTTIENSAFYGFSSSCTVVYTGSVAQWCNITFSNEYSNPLWYSHKLIISGVEITDLVIPEGVTEIKQNTFVNYSQLKLVTIPSTVTAIGYNAFYNCYKLQPVTIPTTVTSIGVNAFYNVPMLLGINSSFGARCINGYIENGLYYTNSSKTTFVGASPYLDSIIIPNIVTSIISNALYGYDHLRYLYIPSSVTTIGLSAFQDVPKIYYYGTASGRPWGARAINVYEENGLYYTSSAKDTIVYADADLTNVVIPNTVITVNDYAFINCHNLTSLTLGSGITTLGDYAFSGTAIDTLYYNAIFYSGFMNNVKKYGLDSVRVVIFNNPIMLWPEYLIRGNQRLTYVDIGISVTTINDYAFSGCRSLVLVTIPNSVTSIGEFAFSGCDNLTSVIIPNSMTSIGYAVFYNCTGLITVTIPNSVTSIGNSVFSGCTNLSSITIPNSVTTIGNYAFDGCTSLASVTIPNSVTSIGISAFEGCTSLASVTIPNSVTSIGISAFEGCTSLQKVSLGESITSFGSNAFHNTAIDTLYYNIDSIGDFVSYNRPRWDSLRVAYIGNSVRYWPDNLFRECGKLQNAIIGDSVSLIRDYAFANCTSLVSITIPDAVNTIGAYAFSGCSSLASVSLGREITSIGDNAFYNSRIDTLYYNIDSIGDFAWNNRPGWDSVRVAYIGNDVHYWPNYLLNYYCKKLHTVIIGDSITNIRNNAFDYCTRLASITIPNSVTSIGSGAFSNCTALTSISIPNSVTSIGSYAFHSCTSLTSITIPNSITSINSHTFDNCTNLASITIPNSVTSIGSYAFKGCTSLASITIPDSVTTINDGMFENCTSLDSVWIPNSITSIGNYSFGGCSNIDTLIIPGTISSIGNGAFSGCTNLVSIVLPDSITEIRSNTFTNCSSLVSIEIPDNVTNIMSNAFNGCISLQKAYIGCNVTTWDRTAFTGCVSLDTLYYNAKNLPYYTVFNPPLGLDSVRMAIFGDSVFSIPAYLFLNYPSLSPNSLNTVIIGKNVAYIGTGAFSCCNDIASVWMMSPIPPSNPSGFHNAQTVHILCGALQAYQNEWGGSNYQEHLCDLAVFANDGDGTISIGALSWDSTIVISASSNYGYHFDHWSNASQTFYSTANPDTINFHHGDTITAYFERNAYYLSVETADSVMGYVTGSDSVLYLDSTIISAIPNYGYHFTHWDDGDGNLTQNPRTVNVIKDTVITALFDYNRYYVSLATNDFIKGDWPIVIDNNTLDTCSNGYYITCRYNYLSDLTIIARPNPGYHFTIWSDGDTNNPRNITLTQDTTITAIYANNRYTVTAVSSDTSLGIVTGGGTYDYLDVATLTATCTAEHYHFKEWHNPSLPDNEIWDWNPAYITVNEDSYWEAVFEPVFHSINYYDVYSHEYGLYNGKIHSWSDEYDGGTSDVGSSFPYGSIVTLEAIPNEGYHFGKWENGSQDPIESLVLTGDTTVGVVFIPDSHPEICMVSVQNNRNVLMWTKEEDEVFLAEYNIFREGVTSGDYDLIATVPYDSLSVWVDEESSPMSHSYRYKISATDIYGVESEESEVHKTMHLTISRGVGNNWNLVWTPYEGATYSSYQIYRGSNADNVELIDQFSSNGNTTYTDYNVNLDNVYYQVAIIKDEPCYDTKSTNIIRSNIATNDEIDIVVLESRNTEIELFPNPADENVIITSKGIIIKLELMDMSGRIVQTIYSNDTTIQIPLVDIASGSYMLRITTTDGTAIKKLIIK